MKPIGALIEKIQSEYPEALYLKIILPDGVEWEAFDSKQIAKIIPILKQDVADMVARLAHLN